VHNVADKREHVGRAATLVATEEKVIISVTLSSRYERKKSACLFHSRTAQVS
jgi:hypothetical protein